MNSLKLLERILHQYQRGVITAEEFVAKLTDNFAGDESLDTKDAPYLAAIIPASVRALLIKQIDYALSPEYFRRAFAMGGGMRTKEQEHADALRETAREKAWVVALKPLLS